MHPVEQKRLSRQCQAILERLRRGPATNRELAALSLKYTGRISDLRAAGYAIENYDRDHETGLSWYRLNLAEATTARFLDELDHAIEARLF